MRGDYSLVLYLNDNERRAIEEFINKISGLYDIQKVILFGSKARGDFNEDSDIDLLIVMPNQINHKDRWELSDTSAEISIDYGVDLNCIYYAEDEWESNNIVNPLLKSNIDKDGISIVQR